MEDNDAQGNDVHDNDVQDTAVEGHDAQAFAVVGSVVAGLLGGIVHYATSATQWWVSLGLAVLIGGVAWRGFNNIAERSARKKVASDITVIEENNYLGKGANRILYRIESPNTLRFGERHHWTQGVMDVAGPLTLTVFAAWGRNGFDGAIEMARSASQGNWQIIGLFAVVAGGLTALAIQRGIEKPPSKLTLALHAAVGVAGLGVWLLIGHPFGQPIMASVQENPWSILNAVIIYGVLKTSVRLLLYLRSFHAVANDELLTGTIGFWFLDDNVEKVALETITKLKSKRGWLQKLLGYTLFYQDDAGQDAGVTLRLRVTHGAELRQIV